ncbi:hypothetical protein PACTADRAFT_3568 [Pachysolen tannophilus NRRL Y-2460]|uniref:ATPase expression protein 2, mitochondrial n=1 Tax=Pachysolen tannophilus NRRL Y-2460 TaxID=669874 RepID=A0A1E4TSH8_PACTA|nr:hypothetical protein PACTADRAFT_3568 [Pachysolen tannophilus NRRL Y-2460]
MLLLFSSSIVTTAKCCCRNFPKRNVSSAISIPLEVVPNHESTSLKKKDFISKLNMNSNKDLESGIRNNNLEHEEEKEGSYTELVSNLFQFNDVEISSINNYNLLGQRPKNFINEHHNTAGLITKKLKEYLFTNKFELLLKEFDELIIGGTNKLEFISTDELNLILLKCIDYQLSQLNTHIYEAYYKEIPRFNKNNALIRSQINKIYDYIKAQDKLDLISIKSFEKLIELQIKNFHLNYGISILNDFENLTNLKLNTNLYNLKLQLIGGALPIFWDSNHLFMSNKIKDCSPRQQIDSAALLKTLTENKSIIPDLKTYEFLILSMGKSRNLPLLRQFIFKIWGINNNNNNNNNFEIEKKLLLNKNSIFYPDHKILRAILNSFSYNNEFFEGINYVNIFLKNYKLINLQNNPNFWLNLFKWGNLFLRKQKLNLKKKQRTKLVDDLWSLMISLNTKPTLSLYKEKLQYLKFETRLKAIIDTLPEIYELYIATRMSPLHRAHENLLVRYLHVIIMIQVRKSGLQPHKFHEQSRLLIEHWCPLKMKADMIAFCEAKYEYFGKQFKLNALSRQKKMFEDDDEETFLGLW